MRQEKRGNHPLFGRVRVAQGLSLLKDAPGVYRQVEYPTDEEFAAAPLAYLGGRWYYISPAEAASLTQGGYGDYIETSSGYGQGDYGAGDYGAATAVQVSGYGVVPYGTGFYGEA